MLKKLLPQKRPPVFTKFVLEVEKMVLSLAKYRLLVIIVALAILVGLEYSEFGFGISDTFHAAEVAVYVFLLSIVWALVEVVLRVSTSQKNTLRLLEYKHYISLELTPHQDWDSLVTLLAQRLAKIVNASEAYLWVQDPIMGTVEQIAEWIEPDHEKTPISSMYCPECTLRNDLANQPRGYCKIPENQKSGIHPSAYCFPIYYKNTSYAVVRFILKPGVYIVKEQKQILKNVSDEVAIALMAGRDRKRLSELELVETALAERHTVSQYLHDNLSQNIGYLRMKLDELSKKTNLDVKTQNELHTMKEVAEESYHIVRSKLEDIHPDTVPVLTNFLQEHARKVSKRASLEINFASQGTPLAVSIDVQRAIFYVFQEVLSNIEKHARASKVDILLDWCKDKLVITITDNGVGFNPRSMDTSKHFGLEIVRERMNSVSGKIEIASSENSGTVVKISIPLVVVVNRELIDV